MTGHRMSTNVRDGWIRIDFPDRNRLTVTLTAEKIPIADRLRFLVRGTAEVTARMRTPEDPIYLERVALRIAP